MQPPAFEGQGRGIARSRGPQHLPGFVRETGLPEFGREFHPERLGERGVERQQFAQDGARLAVAAQHGEQTDTQGQRCGVPGTGLQRRDRGRVVEQPDVRLGAKALKRRVLPARPGRVEVFENRGEILLSEQLPHLGQQLRVGLACPGRSPKQQGQGERRHGRRCATSGQGVTVRETASSSPRNSSFEWKNQRRFAGSRSPLLSISPSRWMYSPSFADSSW